MRELKVTGRGEIELVPDLIELRIEFTGTDRSNKKMLALCSSYVKSMQDELEEYGFHKEDLKLDSFRIRNTKGNRLIDSKKFEFVQNGKMRFPADMEKLGSALHALSSSKAKPSVQIEYTVRDPEAAKQQMIEKAVKDATAKAEYIAKAAGVKLKDIQGVSYSFERIDFRISPFGRDNVFALGDDDDDCDAVDGDTLGDAFSQMGVDNIKASDTVTVTWEIE